MWKNHNQLKKNCTKIEKEEICAHQKRARSALNRDRTFEFTTVMHHKLEVLGPTRQGS